MTKHCITCGKPYVPRSFRQKYCCHECNPTRSPSSLKEPLESVCVHCGKTYMAKTPNQKYCSRSCYADYWKSIARKHVKYDEYIKLCATCKEWFRTKNIRQLFCSNVCEANAPQPPLPPIKCRYCGMPITKPRLGQYFCGYVSCKIKAGIEKRAVRDGRNIVSESRSWEKPKNRTKRSSRVRTAVVYRGEW